MDLLNNAIESIRLGVEDFQGGTHARLMSAARNIHAGLLLLYKEAPRRMSPEDSNEVLVKARIVPARDKSGDLIFVGTGSKTADTQQIRERFAGLGISTDWKRLYTIAAARNDVEHYYPKLNQQALHGVVAGAFLIIRTFVASELNAEPRELLGEPTWQAMLQVTEIYDAEKAQCDEAIAAAQWPSDAVAAGLDVIACSECGSDLLQPGEQSSSFDCPLLVCRACGATVEPDSFIPKAVADGLSHEMYLSHTDGNETPYTQCPECSEDTYIIEEQRCALCGHEAEHRCAMCGSTVLPEDLDSSQLCGWCAHQMGKDD